MTTVYNLCKLLIDRGRTDGLQEKMDVYLAADRLTPEEYNALSKMLTAESQVYFLATEYGVINMEGRSTWERAEGLISIAHPDFRDELIKEAEKRKIWRRSNKR